MAGNLKQLNAATRGRYNKDSPNLGLVLGLFSSYSKLNASPKIRRVTRLTLCEIQPSCAQQVDVKI